MADVVVPEGHQVRVTGPTLVPSVTAGAGGAWVAQLGVGSDAIASELDAVIADIELLRAKAPVPPRVLLARAREIAELFAPANPPILQCQGLLVWVIDAAALAGAPDAAALVERWLRQLRSYDEAKLPMQVFVHEVSSPRARAVADLVCGLGVAVRVLDLAQRVVVLEVHRPEGVVLSGLGGTQYASTAPRAELPERDEIAARLAPTDGSPLVSAVVRAPRLRALLLKAGDPKGRDALYLELIAREIPLLTITSPDGGVRLQTWPGGTTALAAYIDQSSLLAAARETGLDPRTFNVGHMVPRMLFAWADHHQHSVAINVYRDDGKAEYVIIDVADVAVLGRGEVPATTAVS